MLYISISEYSPIAKQPDIACICQLLLDELLKWLSLVMCHIFIIFIHVYIYITSNIYMIMKWLILEHWASSAKCPPTRPVHLQPFSTSSTKSAPFSAAPMLLGQSHLAPFAHRNPGPGWCPIRRQHRPAQMCCLAKMGWAIHFKTYSSMCVCLHILCILCVYIYTYIYIYISEYIRIYTHHKSWDFQVLDGETELSTHLRPPSLYCSWAPEQIPTELHIT